MKWQIIKKIKEKFKNRSEYGRNDKRSKVNLGPQIIIIIIIIIIKTFGLRSSFVSVVDTFNIYKERIAKSSFFLSYFAG